MQKLSMKIDHFNHFDDEFYAYISALDGVDQVEQKPNGIHITYDPNKISIHRILLEIKLYSARAISFSCSVTFVLTICMPFLFIRMILCSRFSGNLNTIMILFLMRWQWRKLGFKAIF